MALSRRDFGKLALAGIPAVALFERPLFGAAQVAAKPNSKFGGVQIGVITYSYRQMPDQSAEATLKYILDSGINAVELMDTPAELFAGRPAPPVNPAARAGGGGLPGGGGGRAGGTPCVPGQGPAPGAAGARAGGGGGGRRAGAPAEL